MVCRRIGKALLVALLLASLPTWAPMALGENALLDPHPLRTADTSSPRATLQSFLADASSAIEAYQSGEPTQARFRARKRAIETLDLTTTPHGSSSSVQSTRMLLLKEILDRIELPPWEDVPGVREVAKGSITEWTIPGTPITIGRVQEGPRAGQFLFSAGSVDRLDRYFRRVRHLPYKPGASVGAYDAYLDSDFFEVASAARLRNRLRPIDASSPRSTLEDFLHSVNRAYAIAVEANAALQEEPPTITRGEARRLEERANNLLRRARGALDLSQVPEALRGQVGLEAVLQLKEILDRGPLPPLDSVPGTRAMLARSPQSGPFRWRIPDTRLEIAEMTQGDRAGEFLFSAATVASIGEYYEELRDLPYRTPGLAGFSSDYRSPETSEGFYYAFISTPGHLIPRASLPGRLIAGLPSGLKTLYGEQTLWQWLSLAFLCLVAVPLATYGAFRLVTRLRDGVASPWEQWLSLATPVLIAAIVRLARNFVDDTLNVTGPMLAAVTSAATGIVVLLGVWGTFLISRAVAETVIASPRIGWVAEESLDASLVRIAARVFAFLVAAWVVIAGIQDLGVDVIPLVAGLGVGGLAVALAAQTTFANFIGSLILFANKPVRRGDFCRYGDQIGTVEEIGLHSTRIRSLERTIVTVPNADFSQMALENISKRDQRLFRPTLHLRYETTPEQLRYVLARIRELLLGHPRVTGDPARVRFEGYGPGCKNIGIFAYLRCQDQNTFLAIQEDLLLRIEDVVSEAGTAFAIPAQTSYLAQAPGLDVERGKEAESRVEQWRAEDRLPFPEFDAQEREAMTDVLDYPPQGSPGYSLRQSPSGGREDEPPERRSDSSWLRPRRKRPNP